MRLFGESIVYMETLPDTYQLLPAEGVHSLPRTGNYLVPCRLCVFQWVNLDNIFSNLLSRKDNDYLLDSSLWLSLPGVQDFRSRQIRVIWKMFGVGGQAMLYAFHNHRWNDNWVESLSLKRSLEGAVTAMYLSWGMKYHLGRWHGCYGIDNTPIFVGSHFDIDELIKVLGEKPEELNTEDPFSCLDQTKIPFGMRIECNEDEITVRILADSPTAGIGDMTVKIISGQITEESIIDLFDNDERSIY